MRGGGGGGGQIADSQILVDPELGLKSGRSKVLSVGGGGGVGGRGRA